MEHSKAPGSDPAGLKFCRQVLHPLLGLSAVTCLLAVIGWTGSVTAWQHWTTVITGFVFALERAWVFVAVNPRGQERRRLIYHLAVAAAVFCVSAQLLVQHLSGSESWSTGLHLFHVVLGLGVLTFCFAQSRRDLLSDARFRLVEGGACFWHMVDLLWIILFPLLYLVR